MKTPKALAERILYSGEAMATKVATCRRLAGGLANVEVTTLELSDAQILLLAKARALMEEIATTYAKAAKLKKAAEAARAQRRKDVRAAMKDNFDALASTADKVAAIGTVKGFMLERGGLNLNKLSDAEYLVGHYFRDCLTDIGDGIALSSAPDLKDLTPAAAVSVVWLRFQDKRAQLQDKHAQVIVRVDRLLAGEPATEAGRP